MSVYESELKLEDRMIDQLVKQGYEKVQIKNVKELEDNFTTKLTVFLRTFFMSKVQFKSA